MMAKQSGSRGKASNSSASGVPRRAGALGRASFAKGGAKGGAKRGRVAEIEEDEVMGYEGVSF